MRLFDPEQLFFPGFTFHNWPHDQAPSFDHAHNICQVLKNWKQQADCLPGWERALLLQSYVSNADVSTTSGRPWYEECDHLSAQTYINVS